MASLDFPLQGGAVSIVEQNRNALLNIIQSKYGCKIDIDGVEPFGDPGMGKPNKPCIVPEKRWSHTLPKGLIVSVWKADLTNFCVDAVVNAANERLQHDGGLAQALCEAGGPEIQRESNIFIDNYGKLATGDAVVTTAGRLPCNMIIHAVGPSVPRHANGALVSKAAPLLNMAVLNILTIAKKKNIRSVAIPALSSGLFNFPLPECANIIVSAVKQYHDDYHYKGTPSEVFLVNHDEPSVSHMQRACSELFSSTSPSNSQAAVKPRKGAVQTSTHTVTIGKVSLILRKGKIEEQQADVIVSTTSPSGDLSGGQISKAILMKAGKGLQDEIYRIRKPHKKHVIVTSAYKLHCKQVYHTLCVPKGTYGQELPEEILFSATLDCMRLAASCNHSSIVFPAIGTGNLKFSKTEVSNLMINATMEFARHDPKMMEIHFVIYPSEEDTFKAFYDKMNTIPPDNMGHPRHSQGLVPHDNFGNREISTSKIRLSATSAETTQEARRWLENLFSSSNCVTIRNNFIQHFGEQEYQKLSRETKSGVSIVEVLEKGCAHIIIKGRFHEDVTVAVLQVEEMLCQIQRTFLREKQDDMSQSVSYERKPVERRTAEFTEREKKLMSRLQVIKVERVENRTLKHRYELKKKQLNSPTPAQTMYQRISAEFCNMVSHIGFQREYAPPDDPKYGDGIYFAHTVDEAMYLWKDRAEEKYIYFVEAQVLTGKSTEGFPGLIVPPALSTDPLILYDSVKGTGAHVIFSGYQALPEYIIICEKM